MDFSKLFKTSSEIRKEQERQRRALIREVNRSIENTDERIRALEKERSKTWEKARNLVSTGQKSEAARLLNVYKALGLQINHLNNVKFFAWDKMNKVESADDVQRIVDALAKVVQGMGIDPDALEGRLATTEEGMEDIRDFDKIMDRAYAKDQERMRVEGEAAAESEIGDDVLMRELEQEAAASVLGTKANEELSSKDTSISDINAGRDRLKALLENKK